MSLTKHISLILSFLFLSNIAFAQESDSKINYQGKDVSSLKHAWSAQWITHPSASTLDYNVFLYRREFDLTTKPKEFIIYVSADNRYKLFVNGQKVCAGPARGDINHWRYETVDIAPYLDAGKNVIAAEVVNFGEFRHAAQHTFQTAFIL
ncbi:MAG TPA: alpha-rhamnosidase, partial [Saprospiraceae bacterium]|nr:alpha-rhamnosidase [Saprospiraceae bacterium]